MKQVTSLPVDPECIDPKTGIRILGDKNLFELNGFKIGDSVYFTYPYIFEVGGGRIYGFHIYPDKVGVTIWDSYNRSMFVTKNLTEITKRIPKIDKKLVRSVRTDDLTGDGSELDDLESNETIEEVKMTPLVMTVSDVETVSPPVKRGRGRPRKHPKVEKTVILDEDGNPIKKKRGRPKKVRDNPDV